MSETPKSPRQSIHERSLKGFPIQIQRNAYPRGNIMQYTFTNFESLLVDAQRILNLPSQAKKVFDARGNKVESEDAFERKKLYYISCGESFAQGVNVTQKMKQLQPKTEEEEEDQPQQTFYEQAISQNKEKEAQKRAEAEMQQTPEKSKQQERREKETAAFNRLLALSNKTVQEAFIESTLSAFASTEPDEKAKLEKFDQLSTLTKNTQYYDFINQLITNQLAPTFATSPIQDEVDMFFIDMMKGLTIDELKFIITGLPQTGKSSVLFSLATVLFRKIQQSSAFGTFLFFPLNIEKLTLELKNIRQVYYVWVTTALTGARYSNYAIAPFIPTLIQWFCSIPTQPVAPSFPPLPQHVHGINFKAIHDLGVRIFQTSHDKKGLADFVAAVVEFPKEFAKAIGLQQVFYVLDHFEYIDVQFYDDPNFPDYVKPTINFAAEVCRALETEKYVVSCQTETAFSKAFTCYDATPIDTEGIIESVTDGRKITLLPLRIEITTADCKGCPGILAQFTKVADLAENIGKEPPQNKNVKIRTSIGRSRNLLLKKQLLYLVKCIAQIGNDRLTLDTLNVIDDGDIKVKVEGQKEVERPKEEEEEEEEDNTDQKQKPPQSGAPATGYSFSTAPASHAKKQSSAAGSPSNTKGPVQSPQSGISNSSQKKKMTPVKTYNGLTIEDDDEDDSS